MYIDITQNDESNENQRRKKAKERKSQIDIYLACGDHWEIKSLT
jgi:hypothetical protein